MNKSTTILIPILLVLGLAGGFFLAKLTGSNPSGSQPGASSEKEILYWKAPMDPNFRRDTPGKSPMGMDLVPVYAGGDDADDRNLVRISPTVQNNIGVRLGAVERTNLSRDIKTVGFVQVDEDEKVAVDVRTQGWVEHLFVKSIGDKVVKGQPLFDLYSKPLVTAQDEYLQAKQIGRTGLIKAAKSRLQALGMSNSQINALAKRGKSRRLVRIFAPQDGIVTMMGVGEGGFVRPGTTVLMLADLSTVWVLAEVFETQGGWVKPGQTVTMEIDSAPGRTWTGGVDYIYPVINSAARTLQVRLRFDNPDGVLRPQGYARVTIKTEPRTNVLSIDREALIRTDQSTRVILALGDGQFQPAQVVTGLESGNRIEIIEGLDAGEKIVISAQFLIDSESSLRGTLLRMTSSDEIQMSKPKEAKAKGVVVSLMANHGMITVQHEAIEAFGWPKMEMDFVTDPAFLEYIEEGDAIHFTVLEIANDNDDFVITSILKMEPAQ